MSLTTQCPQCGTTFEVTPEQLRMRSGLVRCGECAFVFDGRAPREEAVSTTAFDTLNTPAVLRQRAQHEDRFDRAATPATRPSSGSDTPSPIPPLIVDPHPYLRPRQVPDFMNEDAEDHRLRVRYQWGVAALLALLVLTVQTAVVFRTTIVASAPVLRPLLETLCQPLRCTVGYERRAERLAIAASSLQPANAAVLTDGVPAQLLLNVTLRNRFLQPQLWPALMLELRDFSDTVVIRRALLPDEYLPESLRTQPLKASAEVALSIPLTVTDAQVSGYQVEVFYP